MNTDNYQQARELVVRTRKASASYIQRTLRIGYNEAAGYIERLEKEGVVSKANSTGARTVLSVEPGLRTAITLRSKNPRRVGNAILYAEVTSVDGSPLFLIETDFGNQTRLNEREVEELFDLGRLVPYSEWRAERARLIAASDGSDAPLPVDPA